MYQMSRLAHQIRERRRARGLTQSALADRSGAGRVTLARLEAGATQDFRLGTVTRLCEALDLELAAVGRGSLDAHETRLARADERAKRIDARRRHAVLAARLLSLRPRESSALLARARANVDRWERQGLCSDHYVSRWRSMLRGSARRVALNMTAHDAWTDALFQNTPWSFALPPAAV
jgi:transcriptional regulator with XRE-family HTH domain